MQVAFYLKNIPTMRNNQPATTRHSTEDNYFMTTGRDYHLMMSVTPVADKAAGGAAIGVCIRAC
jgi:hypothetical protein